jgi:hypothetical protein
VAATGICLFGISVYAFRKNLLACLPLLGLAAGYWMSWKHGLVRADDHVNLFFGFSLLGFASFPAFVDHPLRQVRIMQVVLSGLGCILCFGGIYHQGSLFPTEEPIYSVSYLFETARNLTSLTSYETKMTERLSAQKKRFECPRIKAEVGKATIDVFGSNQGIALLNDLNYHPRPAFQSYSAYTPFLIRANADFYRSDDGPLYVISTFNPLDERFPTQDDPEALRVLLLDYNLVLSENKTLLWRRLILRKTLEEEMTGIDAMEISFGQEIALPGSNLWSVVNIKETALGKLRSFFYKPPMVFISVTDEDHLNTTHRILPTIARSGFILDPYLFSQTDIVGLKKTFEPKPKHILSFRLLTDDSSKKYFANRISIHLFRIPQLTPE